MIGRTHGTRLIGRRKSHDGEKRLPQPDIEPIVSLRCLVAAQQGAGETRSTAVGARPAA